MKSQAFTGIDFPKVRKSLILMNESVEIRASSQRTGVALTVR
jgi:hypothetical protein